MKLSDTLLISLFCLPIFACVKSDVGTTKNEIPTKMKITIGATVFTATLHDNSSANAFKAMLPLTINMEELNGNEKFFTSIKPCQPLLQQMKISNLVI